MGMGKFYYFSFTSVFCYKILQCCWNHFFGKSNDDNISSICSFLFQIIIQVKLLLKKVMTFCLDCAVISYVTKYIIQNIYKDGYFLYIFSYHLFLSFNLSLISGAINSICTTYYTQPFKCLGSVFLFSYVFL